MLVAGRYRLEAVIGRGGMGEVWRGLDEVLGRPVAVKLLLNDGVDASAAARFRLEAQTSARLNHPHVVGMFDFGAWEDRFFLVMELVEGDSLAGELTAGGPLDPDRLAQVAQQAAEGLAAAHAQGIVHRDIKPGNLLGAHDGTGTVRIADFGIARFLDDPSAGLTSTGQIVGTGLYLAPERAIGNPASPASDLYSLGCVLYQLAVGKPPFDAETATALLYQHVDAPPVPPHQRGAALPPAFEAYLLGMLAKRPEDRPTARQTADWFGSGAWRGAPEPLPPELPGAASGHGRSAGPRAAGAPAGTVAPPRTRAAAPTASAAGDGWNTTVHRVPPRRPGLRTSLRRHPRTVAVVGGTFLFASAVLVGLTWF
ncbi:serine/threonine-protein kinase [Streptomyces tropicalis]|uniref:non-specific serine/threonine protein kinase n=1 Tax=Streptomyces tropicalis TaxID=3034234 RepID=A0ABT6AAW7_9ACTN|nr:serine/threonine-protein kinase [Streptomyces tropicalis]MDF3301802.1 serine/threonine-protein kinase [Streptomyces tropicalis]